MVIRIEVIEVKVQKVMHGSNKYKLLIIKIKAIDQHKQSQKSYRMQT